MGYIDSTNKKYAIMQIQQKLRDIDNYENGRARIAVDGSYGTVTRNAVSSFQKKYGLTETGVVNNETWDAINTVHAYRKKQAGAAKAVHIFPMKSPDYAIFPDIEDDILYVIIHMLNIINIDYDDWSTLAYSSVYGKEAQDAIRNFQRKNLLDGNGVIDSDTFNRLADEYERINSQSK